MPGRGQRAPDKESVAYRPESSIERKDLMEEQTEVFELRQEARVNARANMLWLYLNTQDHKEELRLSQDALCEALGWGMDRKHLREAVEALEARGWIAVARNHKPYRYTLN